MPSPLPSFLKITFSLAMGCLLTLTAPVGAFACPQKGTDQLKSEPKEKKSSDGIKWLKNTDGVSYKDVKAKAKKEGKKIFLDFYTKWCGPCKAMDKDVFSTKKIGDFYNKKFVNFKVDAEVGEGKELAKKYKVTGFPTFVYADDQGEPMKRGSSIGYGDVPGMMQLAKIALGEIKEIPWDWYQKQYENGNRDLEFLKNYVQKRLQVKRMPPSMKLKEEIFLATKPEDRFKKDSDSYKMVRWSAIPGNFFYEQLMANKEKFSDLFESKTEKQKFLSGVLMQSSFGMARKQADKIKEQLKKDFPKAYPIAIEGNRIDDLRLKRQSDQYVKEYYRWVKENDLPIDFNPFAASSISSMKNLTKQYAKIGVKAFGKNIKDSPDHFYSQVNYTYLLFKSGEKEQAKVHAKSLRKLTESFSKSRKMKKFYEVMVAIENGEDPTERMLLGR